MRIAIASIIHESNSFAAKSTPLADFRILRGAEISRFYAGAHNEVTGFIEGGARHGYEPVPTLCASATPSGVVQAEAFNWLADALVDALKAAGPIDGILLALHGAFVAENFDNADAEFTRRVRAAFGPGLPLVVTHDPHCSLGEGVVRNCDALVIYKTNPHIDMRERGLQAAAIISAMIRGEARPTMAYRALPMMINIAHQHTSSPPLRDLWASLPELEQQPGVLAASLSLCYQYSDVPAMGNAVVVVTDNDQAKADRIADDLAAQLWALREFLEVDIPSVAGAVSAAIAAAMAAPAGPYVIVDIGDNVGGGSAADATFVLAELIRQNAEGWVVTLADPESVRACMRAGIGATLSLPVGGKTDSLHGAPVTVTGRVKCLHDGKFEERAARHGGMRWGDQGLTAVLEVQPDPARQSSYIVLTELRSAPMSLHQLQSVGIEPAYMKILTVKAAIAWKAAYEPVMTGFVIADTPGATTVNPRRWTYTKVRKDLWGLEGWE
ncbi:MAG: M81 family metallopeptidase [Anaerolineae bacterium]|nr:M81 family metallopeptidase [Anaerolineae bacterium]HQV29374.1 M81 family metallopeptidase [Thermoflexales bacterium]HRA54372.1 M81 family metallopeptidase [Thermoflexales bacterium]